MIQRSRNIPAEQKAIWHQVAGAGKSRVKREFFDLNARDLEALTELAERRVGQRLEQTR